MLREKNISFEAEVSFGSSSEIKTKPKIKKAEKLDQLSQNPLPDLEVETSEKEKEMETPPVIDSGY